MKIVPFTVNIDSSASPPPPADFFMPPCEFLLPGLALIVILLLDKGISALLKNLTQNR